MTDRDDDFYIGYQRRAPAGLARFLRRLVGLLLAGGLAVAALGAALQPPFDPGVFEFGVVREFAGVVQERPHPLLLVPRPGGGEPSRFWLVAEGKRGADAAIAGLDGRAVNLRGTLIHRQAETMIEVETGSMVADAGARAAAAAAPEELGRQTLRGEIVDSKCFFGVMKPGRGKPHRACATLCIRGGIPPVLRVETATGEYRHLLLTGNEGGPLNRRVLHLVGEPVEVSGRVHRSGDLLILAAAPDGFRRLAPR